MNIHAARRVHPRRSGSHPEIAVKSIYLFHARLSRNFLSVEPVVEENEVRRRHDIH
jgi:hypothetical protein